MKTFISIVLAIMFSASLMAQTANLKLNLEKNKTYRIKSINEQNTTVTYGGSPQQIETKKLIILSLMPLNNEADNVVANVRFDTLITNVSMPKMEINSTKAGNIKSSDPSEIVGAFLNRLSKVTLNVKLAPTGNVIEIANLQALQGEITKGIDSIQGQMSGMIKTQIQNMISESSLKGMIETVTAYLPGKQVSVGDKWESHISISENGLGMLIGTTYKLKKITGNMAEVSAESTIEPASQTPVEMNGAQITYDVRGLGKTTLTIDTKTGWIIKTSSKNHTQGNMNIKAQGNDMQMPMESDGVTEVVSVP
jgi:hypothetical protein